MTTRGQTILGLETSCDETAAAVVVGGRRVLSSVVWSQTELHAEYAGVVPEIASRAHAERVLPVVRESLSRAGLGLGMIDAIAVGHRPGLIGSLLVGVSAAKGLAWSLGLPLVGVDHVLAHLYAGVLDVEAHPAGAPRELFPALGLVVSGGHSALYHVESWTTVRRLGSTIDDAMGEAYDKAATILGVPFPGGPNLDRLAREAEAEGLPGPELPVSRLGPESLDLSFSGLKTALLYAVRGVPGQRAPAPPPPLDDARRRALAGAFQRAACDAVMVKVGRALERGAYRSLLAGGGVTANSRLRRELAREAGARGVPLRIAPPEWCVDNAAMIAGLGHEWLAARGPDTLALQASPSSAAG